MKDTPLTVLLFAVAMFSACNKTNAADVPAPAPEAHSQERDNRLALSIAIPLRNSGREIKYAGERPHFHVVLTNTSKQPVNVWRDWNSWGYSALSFEVTDDKGKTWKVQKGPRGWDKNFPDYWTVAAHENLVLDVYFADADTWQRFPRPTGGPQTYTMRAVFETSPDEESKKYSVWTGRVVSTADKYTFYSGR